MFQGLRTVIYHVSDLDRAKAWYISVLGIEPYFDQPFFWRQQWQNDTG